MMTGYGNKKRANMQVSYPVKARRKRHKRLDATSAGWVACVPLPAAKSLKCNGLAG
jgi:hypothetical protein